MKFCKTCFCKTWLPVVVSLLAVNTPSLYAQNSEPGGSELIPACDSVADDPDGDGSGWAPRMFGGRACAVTEDTRPRPEAVEINGQTSYPVNSLNYWDPNVDFANREIECTNYSMNDELGIFEVENVFYITHHLLPDSEPRTGKYDIRVVINGTETHTGTGNWQSRRGRYLSESYFVTPEQPLKMFADPWGEEILFNDRSKGMRFWYGHLQTQGDAAVIDGSKMQECKYTSEGDFLPSGQWDQPPTESGVHTVTGVASVDLLLVKPVIINPETDASVELQQLSWKPESDLFHKKIWCTDYFWTAGSFESTYPEADGYVFMPPQPGDNHGYVYVDARGQGVLTPYEWSIEAGELTTSSLFPTEGWYEPVYSGSEDIRVWTDNAYDSCVVERGYTDQKLEVVGEASEQASEEESIEGPTDLNPNEQAPEEQAPEEQLTEVAEQTGIDGTTLPVSPTDQENASVVSSGGGSLFPFFLILLASGCCARRGFL